MPNQSRPQRMRYEHLSMTDNFVSWVRDQIRKDPGPMLDKIREAFATHVILDKPPFRFESREASRVVMLPQMPGLYLFVAAKPGCKIVIIGGRFWMANGEKIGFSPVELEDVPLPSAAERELILKYLLNLQEACEYAEDQEILEKARREIKELKHHTPE